MSPIDMGDYSQRKTRYALQGAARVIDLFGQLGDLRRLYEYSDSRALAADWENVGNDLSRALATNPELPGLASQCEAQLSTYLKLEDSLQETLDGIRKQTGGSDQLRKLTKRLGAIQEQVSRIRELRDQIEAFSELHSGSAKPATDDE